MLRKTSILLVILLIGLLACNKEPDQVTPSSQNTTSTTNNNSGNASTITYSDQGDYAPFNLGSFWTYQKIREYTNPYSIDTTYYTNTYTKDTIIDSIQYFKIGAQFIHIKDGAYFYYHDGTLVKYMDEAAYTGTTWQATINVTTSSGNQTITLDYEVMNTSASITTNLGVFTGLRVIKEVQNGGASILRYYKEGIGLIKQEYPQVMNGSEFAELVDYQTSLSNGNNINFLLGNYIGSATNENWHYATNTHDTTIDNSAMLTVLQLNGINSNQIAIDRGAPNSLWEYELQTSGTPTTFSLIHYTSHYSGTAEFYTSNDSLYLFYEYNGLGGGFKYTYAGIKIP